MHVIFLGSPSRFMILYMRIGKLRLTHSTFEALKRSKVSWRHKKAPTLQLCVGAWTSDPRSSLPGPFSFFLGPSRGCLSSGAWRVREEQDQRFRFWAKEAWI